ncbi:cysteine hydrolase family protein [Achromobacter aloeverae]|uniref:Cysteine hydrolase n=1 Tax=Achromobacter aloeverae TaxID=1750518 RepID=A0A4Q1HJ73_9BURK|nr:cysteine hydrolase family protein [Achromobacter aloeverae]RXN88147.1 cysteine hydrolase [Achromobacter aloeverae]
MPAPRRALIVIDVQNEYFTGNLPIEYPDPGVSLANINRAVDAAEAHGIPVVIVQHLAPAQSPIFARGSAGAELHPSIAGRPRALLVEKAMASAFAGTELGAWIEKEGIDTLTIVGYMTHNCDDSTIKHARHAGLALEFLNDASGSLPYENRAGAATAEEIHRVFTVVLQSSFAAVLSTDEWLAILENGEPPVRENIYVSNQKARQGR